MDIQLTQTPTSRYSNRQNSSNSSSFDCRTESVLIVYSIPLFEAFYNQSSFIPVQASVSLSFHFVYPLAVNDIPPACGDTKCHV